MSLSRDTIKAIAHLARLDIETAQSMEAIEADLNRIVELVDQISTAETNEDIRPMAHPLDQTQPLRQDIVSETNERESLLKLAQKTEAGLFLVPTVLE